MKVRKRNIFRLVWGCIVITFFIWQWLSYQSRNLPVNTFRSDFHVTVNTADDKITFKALEPQSNLEIIFFQGGLTDPKAYGPLCRKMAESGFTCHLIKMDWRMPAWYYQRISQMFPLDSGHYILGGHSQGGKMAAQFVFENPGLMSGLFLLGTSHPRDIDLSTDSIPTLKLYASLDGLANVEEVKANKAMLPKHTELTEVKGGNHSQFGYLGTLLTDNSAEISLNEQQQLTATALISFFKKVQANYGD